ncbi:hypothetical protein [Halomonas sp. YLB-10]|uniref:hypothetical protein n=1 Tax=Halomonas sp. YLB-10 TaxID=2483111 RepID=UPI003908A9A2
MARATNAEQELATFKQQGRDKEIDAELDAATKAGKIAPSSVTFYRATDVSSCH